MYPQTDSPFLQAFSRIFLHRMVLKVLTIVTIFSLVYALPMLPEVLFVSKTRIAQRHCTEPVTAVAESVRTELHSYTRRLPKSTKQYQTIELRMYTTFAYTYAGTDYHTEYPLYCHRNAYPEGMQLMLYIDPEQPASIRIPEDAALAEFDKYGDLNIILFAAALLLITGGLYLIRYLLSRPQEVETED